MKDEKIVTTAEIDEAMTLLHGEPVIAFEPPAQQIVRDPQGNYVAGKTRGWIKLSIAFREELKKLKGSTLAVFIAICLHVNENGYAWPSVATLARELGLHEDTVTKSVAELRTSGLMKVTPRRGTSNLYEPSFASYGSTPPKVSGSTPPKNITQYPPEKHRYKVEPIKKNQEAEPPADAAAAGVLSLYEQNIGNVTPLIRDDVLKAIAEYGANDTGDAIREMARARAKSWRYALSCLENWRANGRQANRQVNRQSEPQPVTGTIYR